MPEFELKTPVAFIIFNRPDTTERVFAEIARARPPKLLVVGDGPRANREGEADKVAAARAIVERVDWPCEVLTNYSEVNLGCKVRVSSGLDWVFDQVPEAIILEDDCLPHPTFFQFCEELLARYREDTRIALICGTNIGAGDNSTASYYFSRYPHIWGWASWRRVWRKYDVEMKDLNFLRKNENFRKSFSNESEWKHWINIFNSIALGEVNTWDAQVVYLTFTQGMLSIYPCGNLISNIGFRADATHTTELGGRLENLKMVDVTLPMVHPKFYFQDYELENKRKQAERIMGGFFSKLISRIIVKCAKIFKSV